MSEENKTLLVKGTEITEIQAPKAEEVIIFRVCTRCCISSKLHKGKHVCCGSKWIPALPPAKGVLDQ